MKKKSLKETNPYLSDRSRYESALQKNIISSFAIEDIIVDVSEAREKDEKAPQQP